MPQSVLLVERSQGEIASSYLLNMSFLVQPQGSVLLIVEGRSSIGTSPNHFHLGLIEDLESKQEHILDAALSVPTLPIFVLQMFAFARNNGAGPRCFLAQ